MPTRRFLGIAALASGLALSCSRERSRVEPVDGTSVPAPRLAWEEPFPELGLVDAAGAATALPGSRSGWLVLALHARPCTSCRDFHGLYANYAGSWNELGLGFAVVVEAPSADSSSSAPAATYPVLTTRASLFPMTKVLNEPVLVLLDGDHRVRFVGRREGTSDERMQSLFRNYRYLKEPDAAREEIVRHAFPKATRVTLESTIATRWLGTAACNLGLSPWYGKAFAPDGSLIGYAFPMERETNCTMCEPLYLCVGFSPLGELLALVEIDPVISVGVRQRTDRFFERFVGLHTVEGVDTVPQGLIDSEKADHITRALVRAAFSIAARAPLEPAPAAS